VFDTDAQPSQRIWKGVEMAKTTELAEVERFVRKELEKDYPGHTFTEKALPLRKKRNGTHAVHRFDAVSEDNTIVASVKSHSWLTSGGRSPAGKIGQIYESLYFLSLVNAKTKLLVLTDRATYEGFLVKSEGKIAGDVEIKLYPLPPELQGLVNKVRQKASQEMSRK